MIYGYARVSTNHQDTELQLTALKSAGCEKIFEEHASGRKSNRPVLKRLIATMQPGDELVVWKLDRTGRNVLHALLMFQQLQEKGINFRSITDGVDLKTASGRYNWICPYISRHLLSLNPLLACCRRYSRGER